MPTASKLPVIAFCNFASSTPSVPSACVVMPMLASVWKPSGWPATVSEIVLRSSLSMLAQQRIAQHGACNLGGRVVAAQLADLCGERVVGA